MGDTPPADSAHRKYLFCYPMIHFTYLKNSVLFLFNDFQT